jgi:hypothetical protein
MVLCLAVRALHMNTIMQQRLANGSQGARRTAY